MNGMRRRDGKFGALLKQGLLHPESPKPAPAGGRHFRNEGAFDIVLGQDEIDVTLKSAIESRSDFPGKLDDLVGAETMTEGSQPATLEAFFRGGLATATPVFCR